MFWGFWRVWISTHLFCLSPLHAGYLLLSPAHVCVCTCRWEPACSDIAAAAPFGARRAQLHSLHDGPVWKPAWFTVHHIWYIVLAWVLFIDKDDSLGFCMDVVFAHFLLIVYRVNVLLLGCARKQILKVREPNYTSSVRWHVHQYSAIFLNTLQHCCQGCSQLYIHTWMLPQTYLLFHIPWGSAGNIANMKGKNMIKGKCFVVVVWRSMLGKLLQWIIILHKKISLKL